jgi:SRSO17 transposase
MKTFTPGLDPAVLGRLREYAARFAPDFSQSKPARWAGVYLQGLLLDGERKSIEPLSRRIALPSDLVSTDPEQALQQFVNQSPWDDQKVLIRYRALMAEPFGSPEGVFVIDDTSFPKRGRHSVGVQRQYCGALGKQANCQVAVTLHYSGPRGHFPLAVRLHLPEIWTADTPRMDAAGVPEEFRGAKTKGQIALGLIDQVRAEGVRGGTVVADPGYGGAGVRDGLAARGLRYIVGVPATSAVFAKEPSWVHPPRTGRGGRSPSRWVLAPNGSPPVSVEAVAKGLTLRRVSWRSGTKGKLSARFGWVRVWPGHEWKHGTCAHAEPLWLLVEARDDGQVQYALSNLPPKTSRLKAVRVWKQRWRVEQGHQQMKEELGLDHFEGRSGRGFHHHAAMVLLAYGFLLLEHKRPRPESTGAVKKGDRTTADGPADPPCLTAIAPPSGEA